MAASVRLATREWPHPLPAAFYLATTTLSLFILIFASSSSYGPLSAHRPTRSFRRRGQVFGIFAHGAWVSFSPLLVVGSLAVSFRRLSCWPSLSVSLSELTLRWLLHLPLSRPPSALTRPLSRTKKKVAGGDDGRSRSTCSRSPGVKTSTAEGQRVLWREDTLTRSTRGVDTKHSVSTMLKPDV